MPAHVMVPLDGSAFAEQALPMALVIARQAGAQLRLVSVRASLPLEDNDGPAHQYLAALRRRLEPELAGRIHVAVAEDEYGPLEYPAPAPATVADVLARHAQECGVDLIVMTTHGRGGIRRVWLGSVADELVRIATAPVLVLRAQPDGAAARDPAAGFSHVVVPLDGSEAAERALPEARRLGSLFNARYTLVRVVSPLAWHFEPGAVGIIGPAVPPPLSHSAAAAYLEKVAAGMRKHRLDVDVRVLDGPSPAPAITTFAAVHGADLIALTTAGAGGIRRLLLGSVADKVLRSADVPILMCDTRPAA